MCPFSSLSMKCDLQALADSGCSKEEDNGSGL
jgi:hypothetical protein